MNVSWQLSGVPYVELLACARPEYLNQLSGRLKVPRGRLRALTDAIADPERIRELIGGVSEAERRALWVVLLSGRGSLGIASQLAHERVDALTKHPGLGERACNRICATGLAVALEIKGRTRLLMPHEVQAFVWPHFLRDGERFGSRAPVPASTAERPRQWLHDLLVLLAYAQQHSLRLTREERLFRADARALHDRFWRNGDEPEDEEEQRVQWLFAYALDRGLLHNVTDETDTVRVEASVTQVQAWCGRSDAERLDDALIYAVSALWAFPRMTAALALIAHLPPGSVLPRAEVESTLQAYVPSYRFEVAPDVGVEAPYARRSALGSEWSQVRALLNALGLLYAHGDDPAVSADAAGFLKGRWPEAPAEPPIFVQPNLEILASRRSSAQTLWTLHQMSDLKTSDEMERFVLTRESVARALAAELDGGDVERFLNAKSAHPIPQNVAYTIADWSRHWGRIRLAQGVVLYCEDPALAETLRAHPKIRAYLQETLGDRHFLCDPKRLPALRDALAEAGFPALPGLVRPETGPPPAVAAWRPLQSGAEAVVGQFVEPQARG